MARVISKFSHSYMSKYNSQNILVWELKWRVHHLRMNLLDMSSLCALALISGWSLVFISRGQELERRDIENRDGEKQSANVDGDAFAGTKASSGGDPDSAIVGPAASNAVTTCISWIIYFACAFICATLAHFMYDVVNVRIFARAWDRSMWYQPTFVEEHSQLAAQKQVEIDAQEGWTPKELTLHKVQRVVKERVVSWTRLRNTLNLNLSEEEDTRNKS